MNFFSGKNKNIEKSEGFRPQSHQTKKAFRTILRNSWEVRPTSSTNIQRNIYEKWEKFLHMPQLRISSSNKKIKNQKAENQNTNSKVNQYINNFLQNIINNNNGSQQQQNTKSKTQTQFFKFHEPIINEENQKKVINQNAKFQGKIANIVYPIAISNPINYKAGNVRNFSDFNNKFSKNSQTEKKNIQNENHESNNRVKINTIIFDGNMLENNFKLNQELNKFPMARLFTAKTGIKKNNYFLNKKAQKKEELIKHKDEKEQNLPLHPVQKQSINKTAKTEEGTNNISKNIETLKYEEDGKNSKQLFEIPDERLKNDLRDISPIFNENSTKFENAEKKLGKKEFYKINNLFNENDESTSNSFIRYLVGSQK